MLFLTNFGKVSFRIIFCSLFSDFFFVNSINFPELSDECINNDDEKMRSFNQQFLLLMQADNCMKLVLYLFFLIMKRLLFITPDAT